MFVMITQALECEMEFLQFGGDLRVAPVASFVITERGTLPFSERHLFEVGKKMFHRFFRLIAMQNYGGPVGRGKKAEILGLKSRKNLFWRENRRIFGTKSGR